MINYKKFEEMGWSIRMRDVGIFHFKSPRMNHEWMLWVDEVESDEDLLKIEKARYITQVEETLGKIYNDSKNNTMNQLRILINKGLPLPPELKVEFTARLV